MENKKIQKIEWESELGEKYSLQECNECDLHLILFREGEPQHGDICSFEYLEMVLTEIKMSSEIIYNIVEEAREIFSTISQSPPFVGCVEENPEKLFSSREIDNFLASSPWDEAIDPPLGLKIVDPRATTEEVNGLPTLPVGLKIHNYQNKEEDTREIRPPWSKKG